MDKVIFGPAGKPKGYKGKAYEPCGYLNERRLYAYEYQSGRGLRIGEESSKKLKADSKRNKVKVSMHCPYYINMCAKEDDKIRKSIESLFKCGQVGEWMGAYRLVFHPGYYTKQSPSLALEKAENGYKGLLKKCEEEGLEDYTFAPETTGKKSQLGNFDEIIHMCENLEHFEPTIDFAHIHARGEGILNKKEDYNSIFSKLEDHLNIERLHCHFTTIEYTNKGEKRHHTLEENDKYGPNIEDLLQNLIDYGWKATIICETPKLDEDAIKMREIYESLL